MISQADYNYEWFTFMINHHICYIPKIVIAVPDEWLNKLGKTGNPENRTKRLALYSAVKRWVYLSWVLQEETRSVHASAMRVNVLNQIKAIKEREIPRIISPYEITFISPEYTLQTGKLIQFDKNKAPLELDFSEFINQKPDWAQW